MGFGSLAVCGFLVLRAKPLLPTIALTGKVWRDHWGFGRWGLAKTGVEWGGDNSVYALTAVLLKVSDVGALRAMGNLALPLSHISAAVGRLLLPYVSRIAGRQGAGAAKSAVMRALLVYAAGAFVYWLAIAISYKPVVRLLYGGKFDSSAYLAPWIALGMAFCVVGYCFAMGLRALQAPSGVLVVATVTAIASVSTGIPLAWLFGLKGVVAAQCVASVATVSAAWYLFSRRVRNEKRAAVEVPGV
jgi:O-antigen/teichoic acid export membrane protein